MWLLRSQSWCRLFIVVLAVTPLLPNDVAQAAVLGAACAPRAPVRVAVQTNTTNRVGATITAGTGSLSSLQLIVPANVRVQVPGYTVPAGPTTTTLPLTDRPASVTLDIEVAGDGTSLTVPLVVTDDCGPWRSFVGAGRSGLNPPIPGVLQVGSEIPGLRNTPACPTIDSCEPFGLRQFPDGQMSFVKVGGQLELYLVAGTQSYRLVGPDFEHLRPEPATAGSVASILPLGSEAYYRDYAGLMAVLHLPDTAANERLGFFHGEEHCPTATQPPPPGYNRSFRATIGLARSSDAGATWTVLGPAIMNADAGLDCTPNQDAHATGAGQPAALIVNGFVYVYYTNWRAPESDSVHLARAPLGSATDPGAYQKYNAIPGEAPSWIAASSGPGKPVISRPDVASSFAAGPSVSWNTHLGKYLAVITTDLGFSQVTSPDGISWSDFRSIYAFGKPYHLVGDGDPWDYYASLLDPGAESSQVTGRDNVLYHSFGRKRIGSQPEIYHHLVRHSASFDVTAPWQFQLHSGAVRLLPPQRPWVCGGDVMVNDVAIYDSDSTTGAILSVPADSAPVVVTAPFGATCDAADVKNPSALLEAKAQSMLNDGCGSRCLRVRIVYVNQSGLIVSDTWRS
jgi:hypothetical protein